jgi:hypothetical protein
LIDTSDPAKDVVIEKELVDNGRAAYLCIWVGSASISVDQRRSASISVG